MTLELKWLANLFIYWPHCLKDSVFDSVILVWRINSNQKRPYKKELPSKRIALVTNITSWRAKLALFYPVSLESINIFSFYILVKSSILSWEAFSRRSFSVSRTWFNRWNVALFCKSSDEFPNFLAKRRSFLFQSATALRRWVIWSALAVAEVALGSISPLKLAKSGPPGMSADVDIALVVWYCKPAGSADVVESWRLESRRFFRHRPNLPLFFSNENLFLGWNLRPMAFFLLSCLLFECLFPLLLNALIHASCNWSAPVLSMVSFSLVTSPPSSLPNWLLVFKLMIFPTMLPILPAPFKGLCFNLGQDTARKPLQLLFRVASASPGLPSPSSSMPSWLSASDFIICPPMSPTLPLPFGHLCRDLWLGTERRPLQLLLGLLISLPPWLANNTSKPS